MKGDAWIFLPVPDKVLSDPSWELIKGCSGTTELMRSLPLLFAENCFSHFSPRIGNFSVNTECPSAGLLQRN
jgi:hypothetical protein